MVDGTRMILSIILTASLASLPPDSTLGVLPQASAVTGSLSVNPTSGFPGNSVAVTGTAFSGSGIVWFDTNDNAIFDAGEPFTSTTGSSFTVTVTVPVTPAGTCSPNSNVCALRNGPGVLYGYYNMPFSFTLTII